jgi:phosphatidate cytidylyltransferase
VSKNLIQRLAVAAVAIPAILWISYQGGVWLGGMLTLFATVAIIEYLNGEGVSPKEFVFWLALVTVLANVLKFPPIFLALDSVSLTLTVALSYVVAVAGWYGFISFFLLSTMILALGGQTPSELFTRSTRLLWGVVYIGLLYPMVGWVSQLGPHHIGDVSGGDLLLFLFALLWVGDSAAMFGGKAFGKHKLAPTVSPNKTVEGFICGIIGAIVIGVIMYFWKLSSLGLVHVLLISIGCSIFGQLGDLVESMWKRSRGIKDSSALIPGHGGILDRFDSLLFAAPFMYAYLMFVL